jgi:Uma2 family endonuclease
VYIGTKADPHFGSTHCRRRSFVGWFGALTMSIEALKPPPTPTRLLDAVPPDTRVVFHNVTWDAYQNVVLALGERENCRVAFDGENIEMMTLGPFHERQRSRLDWFIVIVAGELLIRSEPMGSTTWRREGLKRAIEPDLCYYFDPAKLAAAAAAADSDDIGDFPNPDLAVEVDVSPPKIDRSGIYAALEVPEFWRVREKSVSIERLGPDGEYVPAPRSRFLPPVRPDEVTRWVFTEDSADRLAWAERLREWARSELLPRSA